MCFEVGEMVRVRSGYRGYYACTILEIVNDTYLVEFSSGMSEYFREDELEIF